VIAVLYKHSNISIKDLKGTYFFILYLLYWVILGTIDTNGLIFKLFNIFNIVIILPLIKDSWLVCFFNKNKIYIIGFLLVYIFIKINPILFFKIDFDLFLHADPLLVSSGFFIFKIIAKVGGYISENNVVKAIGIITAGYVSVEVAHDIASVVRRPPTPMPIIPVVRKVFVIKKTVEKSSEKTFFKENNSEKITTELVTLSPAEEAELRNNLIQQILDDN
jgi:hypothetical protein